MMIFTTRGFTANDNQQATSRYFEKIRKAHDNARLTQFFTMMPKGGDLHHHYSGAIYAETYLDWMVKKNICIDPKTMLPVPCNYSGGVYISVDSLRKNVPLCRTVLENWSDLDFNDHFHLQDQPDQHFFTTFNFFGNISGAYYREGLAEIKARAKKENVQYIETMLTSPGISVKYPKGLTDSLAYFQVRQDTSGLFSTLDYFADFLQSSPGYSTSLKNYMDSLHAYHDGIDDSAFTMRFQAYANRNSSPDVVFTKLFSGFDAVSRDHSSLLTGVNIVAPENGIISMRDYWLHMEMFRFLGKKFPGVKTSLHAGELCLGMVKPEELTWHVRDAVFIARANRIGHGVDIPWETESLKTLENMQRDKIAVEINLTSNEFILGVKNNDHPIRLYFDAGVPLVICTDDAGVSRISLTAEYVKLASRYDFTYTEIKSFVYNSIRYSFLKEREKELIIQSLNNRFKDFEDQIVILNGDTVTK